MVTTTSPTLPGAAVVDTGLDRDLPRHDADPLWYPKFVAENCTARGNCYTGVPGQRDSRAGQYDPAMYFTAAILRIGDRRPPDDVSAPRGARRRSGCALSRTGEASNVAAGRPGRPRASAESALRGDARTALEQEFGLFSAQLGDFQFSIAKPYWSNREKKQKGSGGLFAITVNPYTCRGYAECTTCDPPWSYRAAGHGGDCADAA